MDTSKIKHWTFTLAASALGGGIAGMFAAAFDPSKYKFPQDFGTGKLWPYFFMGSGLTLGGALLKSPLGQKLMAGFQQSQAQLAQSQKDLQDAKATLAADVKQVNVDAAKLSASAEKTEKRVERDV